MTTTSQLKTCDFIRADREATVCGLVLGLRGVGAVSHCEEIYACLEILPWNELHT